MGSLSCRRWVALALVLGLAACGVPNSQQQPPPSQEPNPTTAAQPGSPPGTTPAPSTSLLPAPLYLFASTSGSQQIWRVEADGETMTQVTDEPAPVLDFALSPQDGAIAYVSDNDLIRSDGLGKQRAVLFDGPPMPTFRTQTHEDFLRAHRTIVSNPRWSPDATRIALNFDGVKLIGSDGGPLAALYDVRMPTADDPNMYIYHPDDWSPDGSALRIGYQNAGAEVFFNAFLHLDQPDRLIEIPGDHGLKAGTSGDLVWAADSQTAYAANSGAPNAAAGFWRVDTRTGAATALLTPTTPLILGSNIYLRDDGTFLVFAGTGERDQGEIVPKVMSELTIHPDDTITLSPLRADPIRGYVRWACDGSGAMVYGGFSARDPQGMIYQANGDLPSGQPFLTWLPADGGPAVTLPVEGRGPRWAC